MPCINKFVHCKKYRSYTIARLISHILQHCPSVLQDVSSQTDGIFGCRLFYNEATDWINLGLLLF